MQYAQLPYNDWLTPLNYEQYLFNGTHRQHQQHLSSDASSHTDGSSAYGSSTSHLYDIVPPALGHLSPELQANYEVLGRCFFLSLVLLCARPGSFDVLIRVRTLGLLCEEEEAQQQSGHRRYEQPAQEGETQSERWIRRREPRLHRAAW